VPVPPEYQRASRDFEKFLLDAREASGLVTTNQVYTMVQAVFLTFRCRLPLAEAIRFANVLPPVLRAIFVADWDTSEPQRPFEDGATMTREVQSLRPDHNFNFSPDTAIRDVAVALRKNVDQTEFDNMLAGLTAEARDFWKA